MVVMYPVKAYRQDIDNDINGVMHPMIIIIFFIFIFYFMERFGTRGRLVRV